MKKYPIFEHINHNRYILIFLCDILAFLRNRQINEGCFLCLFDLLLWYIMSKCWVIFALRRNNSEFLQLLQSSTKQGIKRPIIPSFHFMSATFHFMHQLLLLHYNQSSEPPNSIIHPKLVSTRLLFKRAQNHQKQIFLLILLLAPLKIPRPTIKQTLCFQTGTVRGKEKNRVGMGEWG